MPHKKQKLEDTSDQAALIERIDAMMDIKRTDSTPAITSRDAAEPIDIFKDLKKDAPIGTLADQETPAVNQDKPAVEQPTSEPEKITTPPVPSVQKPIEPKPTEAQKPTRTIHISHDAMPLPTQSIKSASTKIPVTGDFDDPQTNSAVDDITKHEGDALFEAQDAVHKTVPASHKSGFGSKLKRLFR